MYFAQQNCGKRCVSVDLRLDAGRDLVADSRDRVRRRARELPARRARPARARLRRRCRPAIRSVVYCSITGYGQDGPMAARRAYAPVMHAELGLDGVHRAPAATPSHAPRRCRTPTCTPACRRRSGSSPRCVQRDRTGEGQHIDVSMAEVMLQATEWTAVELAGGTGDLLHIFGSFNAPVLRLGDGTVVHIPGDPVSSFPAWCVAMERPELLDDERFVDTRGAAHEPRRDARGVPGVRGDVRTLRRVRSGARRRAVSRSGEMQPLTDVARPPNGRTTAAHSSTSATPTSGPLRLPRSPFRFSGGERRHDRTAGVAGRAQPRGASRGARPARRRDRSVGGRRRAGQPATSRMTAVGPSSTRSSATRSINQVSWNVPSAPSSFCRRIPTSR